MRGDRLAPGAVGCRTRRLIGELSRRTGVSERQILPCTHDTAALRPGVLTSLRDQLDILDQRAADLETARRLLRQTIAATENTADGVPTPGTRASTPR